LSLNAANGVPNANGVMFTSINPLKTFYITAIYLSTTSKDIGKALYFETSEFSTYLVSLNFAGGVTIKKYLPPFPNINT
jgi:hypothetical protein